MEKHEIKQGGIYWLGLDRCGYQDKVRPYMVVSNDKSNVSSGDINVVPLSTSTKRLDLPCNVPVGEIVRTGKPCVAKVSELYTVSRDLLTADNWAGQAEVDIVKAVTAAIVHQVSVMIDKPTNNKKEDDQHAEAV